MAESVLKVGDKVIVNSRHFQRLFNALSARDYRIVGPTIHNDVVVYDELTLTEELPIGWTDEQDGGHYRLKKRNDNVFFSYTVGPNSWKNFLFPSAIRLWEAKHESNGFKVVEEIEESDKFAFIGVRSCELHAIAIQDNVFTNGKYIDSTYQSRREKAFIIAVNCGQAGGTCFCVSMGTGPQVTFGFDLVLTELLEEHRHEFVIEVGTEQGAEVLGDVPHQEVLIKDREATERISANTARQMGRMMDTTGIKELLYSNYEHPRWENTASRCLTCGNCTMVCPTCFCTTVEDITDLTGEHAERWRKWDSCFTMDFSYIHGGSVRSSVKSRYRQWMIHKLATWIDQFGTSGCVGCGRCITWCPVAIDITEEVRAIHETELIEVVYPPKNEKEKGENNANP